MHPASVVVVLDDRSSRPFDSGRPTLKARPVSHRYHTCCMLALRRSRPPLQRPVPMVVYGRLLSNTDRGVMARMVTRGFCLGVSVSGRDIVVAWRGSLPDDSAHDGPSQKPLAQRCRRRAPTARYIGRRSCRDRLPAVATTAPTRSRRHSALGMWRGVIRSTTQWGRRTTRSASFIFER